eukprot:gene27241-33932_t
MNNLLSLDPAGATGNDVLGVVANLYDYLVELDPHDLSQVRPALAESWEIAPDGMSITLTLRGDARFQSGRALTAADAAWSLQRVLKLNLAMASPWKSYGFSAGNAERLIQAVDARTLRIALPEPTDPKMVLYTLGTSVSAAILDRDTVLAHQKNGDMGAAWLLTHAAGSGPYALTEWRAKDAMLPAAAPLPALLRPWPRGRLVAGATSLPWSVTTASCAAVCSSAGVTAWATTSVGGTVDSAATGTAGVEK